MLNKLIKRFAKSSQKYNPSSIKASALHIHNEDISSAALKVAHALQKAGYSAYVVGGGVRDLILGEKPKDFDVATNATPEQILPLFRRSRIIGRRFKIVHVIFGKETIEVTTFRGSHHSANKKSEANQGDNGLLLRDNVFGDIETDAIRRDFTVNALYYDPEKREVLDFTNGVKDLQKRQLKLIGDPSERYKEDPVRMLRAIRFNNKLALTISPETECVIQEHAELLSNIPPARLFEEALKLLMSGYATAILNSLHEYHLLQHLFPAAADCLDNGSEIDKKMISIAASNTDKRIRKKQRVTPAFIYAALLWPALRAEMNALTNEQKMSPHDAMHRSAQGIINQQLAATSIPKRFLIPMREIWTLQLRLPMRHGKRAAQLMEHPRFRAAYDFFLLREDAGEELDNVGSWWTQYQNEDAEGREKMSEALGKPRGRRRPRNRRRPARKE